MGDNARQRPVKSGHSLEEQPPRRSHTSKFEAKPTGKTGTAKKFRRVRRE